MKRLLSFYSAFLLLAIFGVSTAFAVSNGGGGTAPSRQARYLTFSNVQSTSATIGWINGNGAGRIVVAYPGAVTTPSAAPATYTVSSTLGTGTVVYNGTGSTRSVVATLSPATAYTIQVFEYSADGTFITSGATLNPRTLTTPAAAAPAKATGLAIFDGLANNTATAYAGGPLLGLKWTQDAAHTDATTWNLKIEKYDGTNWSSVAVYDNLDLGTLDAGTTESYIAYLPIGKYRYSVQAVQGTTEGDWSANSTEFDVTYANVTTNNVADIKSVSNTPVVITITNQFPTVIAENDIKTDALLKFTGATATSKIEKMTYQEGTGAITSITDTDGYTLTDGEVYLSEVLQGLGVAPANTQTPLINHSGLLVTWTITISGLDAGTYSAEVTPVAYTLNGTTKENIGNLAAKDEFSITMANETVTVADKAQTMCGEVAIDFEIEYPAIENVDAIVKNNAILKATPALPIGTKVEWSYEGNAGTDYTVVVADQHETTPGEYDYTEIQLSKITNTTATLVAHDERTDNWEFTIVNADLADEDYSFEVRNVAQIGTNNYEYNKSTVAINGLPKVTSTIDIGNVTTISGAPVIIKESITFPTFTAQDAVLTDALIELSDTNHHGDAKVVSVKYNGTEVMSAMLNPEEEAYKVPYGASKVLLSSIIDKPAAKLNGHSGLTTNWEIVVVYDDDASYSTNVTLTPIAYTEAPVFGTTPTGCYSAIGEPDVFTLTFNPLDTTTAKAELLPDSIDLALTDGKASFTFDIQYPTINGIDTNIKNDALLLCYPAAAAGTVIKWSYNGSPEQTYIIKPEDIVEFPEFNDVRAKKGFAFSGKPNMIWLSKITGTKADLLAHSGRTDHWTFEVSGNEFSSKNREIEITNIAYYGELYDMSDVKELMDSLLTLNLNSPTAGQVAALEKLNEIFRRHRDYNHSNAELKGILPVELSDIADVKAVTGTPIILTQTATYRDSIFTDATVLTDAILQVNSGTFPAGMSIARVTYQDGNDTAVSLPINLNNIDLYNKSEVYLSDILAGGAHPLVGHAGKEITWNFYVTGADDSTTTPIEARIVPVSYVLDANNDKTDEAIIGNEVEFNISYANAVITADDTVKSYCGNTAEFTYAVEYPEMANIDSRIKNNAIFGCIGENKVIPAGAIINWSYNGTPGTPDTVATATKTILLSDITGVRGVDMLSHSDRTFTWEFSIEGLDNEDYIFGIGNIAEITDDNGVTYQPFMYKTTYVDVKASKMTFTAVPTAPTNYGATDGKITISGIEGGNAPYTYAITNVNTTTYNTAVDTAEFTGLAEGKYYVKVIDAKECSAVSDSIIVTSVGPLLVNEYLPVDNSTDVVGNADFQLTFNKSVTRGVNGWVKIWDASVSPANMLEQIQYNDASRIVIAGNVVTIKHNALAEPGSYYITIDSLVFRDLANVYFDGITAPNSSATPVYEGWNFETQFEAPVAVENLRRITNNKTTITIAYNKPATVNVLVLAKEGVNTSTPAITDYTGNTLSNTGALTSATAADYDAAPALGGNGNLADYHKVYAGTEGQIKVTNLTANTNTRFYVITYAEDGNNFKFNTNDVRVLDWKTNRFKDGVEGENETANAFGVSVIAPNPVSDMINFTVDAVETSEFTYTVYSMTGETLYTMNQVLTAGSNKASIAVSNLGSVAAGTYLLRIANGSDETLVPFVIVK